MTIPIVLAHGALGIFDEVILLSVAAAFVVIMGITWVKSRNQTDDEPEPTTLDAETISTDDAPDRYKLD
jgi:hypothetical protein